MNRRPDSRSPLRVYKEMDLTYREVAQTLLRLGYQDRSDEQNFRFTNEKFKSEVELPLPKNGGEEFVQKALIVGFTYIMAWKGVLKDMDDFAKMVERERLQELKKERTARAA